MGDLFALFYSGCLSVRRATVMGEQAPPIPAKSYRYYHRSRLRWLGCDSASYLSARSNVLSPRHSDIIARASPHLRRLYSPKLDKTLLQAGECVMPSPIPLVFRAPVA